MEDISDHDYVNFDERQESEDTFNVSGLSADAIQIGNGSKVIHHHNQQRTSNNINIGM
jgi:hypothetical protein